MDYINYYNYNYNEFHNEFSNSNNFTCASRLYFFPQIMFYSMMTYYIFSLIKYVNKKDSITKSNNLYLQNETFLDFEVLGSGIEEDLEEIKKQQEILDNMLSKKSLEREFILYYIFEIKGNYQLLTTDRIENGLEQEIFEEYNTYDEFKQLCLNWDLNNFIEEENSSDSNEIIQVGDKEYNINSSQLIFISWLYRSGIYNFLTTTPKIKLDVLNEMNSKKLLKGNVFLRYHLLDL